MEMCSNYQLDGVVVVCWIEMVVFAYLDHILVVLGLVAVDIGLAGDSRYIHPCLLLLSPEVLEMSLASC
jgi:hypothetical protein